jgi:DNA-binding GntR family transcriptional regulator
MTSRGGNDDYAFPSRTEYAVVRLREAIVLGELRPGERLTTANLSRRWAISQTPLREAFQRLAAAGLVELSDGRGASVAPIQRSDLMEIFELRVLLEPLALRRSLEHADDGWRQRVTETHDELARVLRTGLDDKIEFDRAHHSFHTALLANCDSRWLLRLLETLVDNSRRYRLLSLAPRGGARKLLAEHRQLHKLSVGGDAEGATQALVEHLQLTMRVL